MDPPGRAAGNQPGVPAPPGSVCAAQRDARVWIRPNRLLTQERCESQHLVDGHEAVMTTLEGVDYARERREIRSWAGSSHPPPRPSAEDWLGAGACPHRYVRAAWRRAGSLRRVSWWLELGKPVVGEVRPACDSDGLIRPPEPAIELDAVAAALWRAEPARSGMPIAVRCLATWWRVPSAVHPSHERRRGRGGRGGRRRAPRACAGGATRPLARTAPTPRPSNASCATSATVCARPPARVVSPPRGARDRPQRRAGSRATVSVTRKPRLH
jgi:hypothetical protein